MERTCWNCHEPLQTIAPKKEQQMKSICWNCGKPLQTIKPHEQSDVEYCSHCCAVQDSAYVLGLLLSFTAPGMAA